MNLHDYLVNACLAKRAKTLSESPQLTLGELILKLKNILDKNTISNPGEEEPWVCYDFGTAIPTTLASWRGIYSELALGYQLTGYDTHTNHGVQKKLLSSLLSELEGAIGSEYIGWKGGTFIMNKNTPVWVDNPGNSSNTAIVEVVEDGFRVILMTQYCES